jgi:hypothetical protein
LIVNVPSALWIIIGLLTDLREAPAAAADFGGDGLGTAAEPGVGCVSRRPAMMGMIYLINDSQIVYLLRISP